MGGRSKQTVRATDKWCVACPPDDCKPAVHSHHVHPLHVGGDVNGLQVGLCHEHHDLIHALSSAVLRREIDFDGIRGGHGVAVSRLVASIVRATMQHRKQNPSPKGRPISIHIEGPAADDLRALKALMGMSSMEMVITSLLRKERLRLQPGVQLPALRLPTARR